MINLLSVPFSGISWWSDVLNAIELVLLVLPSTREYFSRDRAVIDEEVSM